MLQLFGIKEKTKKRASTFGIEFSKEDITIDEDHPPAEALGSDLSKLKPLFTPDAWAMINKSGKWSTKQIP